MLLDHHIHITCHNLQKCLVNEKTVVYFFDITQGNTFQK